MKSNAAIFEAIGRAKAVLDTLPLIAERLDLEVAVGALTLTPQQREHLVRVTTQIASKAVTLAALLHEIADTQPTGETHARDAVASSAQ